MSKRSLPTRRVISAAVTAAALLAVTAACGGTDHSTGTDTHNAGTASAQAGTEHNQADLSFVQSMIPHHQQALEMAATAETKATNPEVKALSTKIKQAQGPEIDQMNEWLTMWGAAGASMPAGETHGGMPSMGATPTAGSMPGMHSMPGMMTEEEMTKFSAMTGADFDKMFLEMMIRHHLGAIEMAKTQQQQGLNPDAKALAATVEKDQAAEITQMQTLLGK
jgi:uncharacterized protein (DUF305 family)